MVALLSIVTANIQAQTVEPPPTVNLDFPIYVEDAQGNRDTLTLGLYDGAPRGYNPQLGERDLLNVPYDSILDARFITYYSPLDEEIDYTGKKLVMTRELRDNTPREPCFRFRFSRNVQIVVNAKYGPITMSWDTTAFNTDKGLRCWSNTIITDDKSVYGYSFDWWSDAIDDPSGPGVRYSCMSSMSSVYFDGEPASVDFSRHIVAGRAIPELLPLFTVHLRPTDEIGVPCSFQPIIDNTDEEAFAGALALAPNPAQNFLDVTFAGPPEIFTELTIVNAYGQLLTRRPFQASQRIDLQSLRPGMYYLQLTDGSRRRVVTRKFIKL